jgi:hypothetical protein
MVTYYYETENGCGSFKAENDNEAKERKPRECLILYKESNTTTGVPFIEII